MGTYLTERELQELNSARDAFESPVPTQIISNGEFTPLPQTPQQKQVEARIRELTDVHARRQGWHGEEPDLRLQRGAVVQPRPGADYGALHPDKFDEIKQTYQLAGGLVPNASCGYIKKTA